MRRLVGLGFALVVLLAACGGGTSPFAGTAATTTTAPASTTAASTTTSSTTPPETATTVPPAPTTPETAATTTSEAASDLPRYSEIVADYPPGTDLCTTRAGISGGEGGAYALGGYDGQSASVQIRNGETLFFCLGAQYVVTGPMVDEDGLPIPVGARLTLDADFRFVQVSSFD